MKLLKYDIFKLNISSRYVVPLKYIVYHDGSRRLDLKILNIDYFINTPFFRNPGQIPLYIERDYPGVSYSFRLWVHMLR